MATIHQPRRIVDLVLDSTIDVEQAATRLAPRRDGRRQAPASGDAHPRPGIVPFEVDDELELKEPEP